MNNQNKIIITFTEEYPYVISQDDVYEKEDSESGYDDNWEIEFDGETTKGILPFKPDDGNDEEEDADYYIKDYKKFEELIKSIFG